jgi:hypothetical protein
MIKIKKVQPTLEDIESNSSVQSSSKATGSYRQSVDSELALEQINEFNLTEETPFLSFFALMIALSVQIIYQVAFLIRFGIVEYPTEQYCSLVLISFTGFYGWLVCLSRFYSSVKAWLYFSSQTLEEILAILLCLMVAILLTLRELVGACDDDGADKDNQVIQQYCNQLFDDHFLPAAHTIMLILFPVLFDNVLPSLRWKVVLLCFVISSAFLIGNLVAFEAYNSTATVVWGILFNGLSIFAKRINNRYIYQKVARITKESVDLKEEKRHHAETNANEWRNMLANIAHDLKSVSI